MEPIAFGLPVIFGPKFQKFEEAVQLTKRGGAFVIHNSEEFFKIFTHLQGSDNYINSSKIAKQYIVENQGATEKVLLFIQAHNLLS
ncbi:MAG: hypothetical protein LRY55_06975 [Leadbetterella sp.]|nr:hypothetical protein [Leadbetterella sp.]